MARAAQDALRRLVWSDLGALNATGDGLLADPIPRTTDWSLDDLGNWSGDDPNSFVRKDDSDGDGAWDDREFAHHATNCQEAPKPSHPEAPENQPP